jgi:hypothetical protein
MNKNVLLLDYDCGVEVMNIADLFNQIAIKMPEFSDDLISVYTKIKELSDEVKELESELSDWEEGVEE